MTMKLADFEKLAETLRDLSAFSISITADDAKWSTYLVSNERETMLQAALIIEDVIRALKKE